MLQLSNKVRDEDGATIGMGCLDTCKDIITNSMVAGTELAIVVVEGVSGNCSRD